MGRRMCVLLTCAWVLWQVMTAGTQMMRTPVTGYETRAECLDQAREAMQPSETMKPISEGLLQHRETGALFSYTCLPDTVRP